MHNIGTLRPIDPSELELMLSWRNAPGVRANMYTRHEIPLTEHLAWWARANQRPDQQYWMYEYHNNPLGIVALTAIDEINANCTWAFYAAPDAPRGTGSKMEFLALERVFNQIGLQKLYCEVLAFNTPVIKLHQKFGFQIEGIFRKQHRLDDELIDIYRLGLLAAEWANKRPQMLEKISSHQEPRP